MTRRGYVAVAVALAGGTAAVVGLLGGPPAVFIGGWLVLVLLVWWVFTRWLGFVTAAAAAGVVSAVTWLAGAAFAPLCWDGGPVRCGAEVLLMNAAAPAMLPVTLALGVLPLRWMARGWRRSWHRPRQAPWTRWTRRSER